jgi:hypothetical protein
MLFLPRSAGERRQQFYDGRVEALLTSDHQTVSLCIFLHIAFLIMELKSSSTQVTNFFYLLKYNLFMLEDFCVVTMFSRTIL